jgi:hypothetical protein
MLKDSFFLIGLAVILYILAPIPPQGFGKFKYSSPLPQVKSSDLKTLPLDRFLQSKYVVFSPETIIIGPLGEIYTGAQDWLVHLEINGTTTKIAHLIGPGIGGVFSLDGKGPNIN